MTRFPDEEPEAWEQDWQGWSDARRPVCTYCAEIGHEIRHCPELMEDG
jgi:hypothetical protein